MFVALFHLVPVDISVVFPSVAASIANPDIGRGPATVSSVRNNANALVRNLILLSPKKTDHKC